MFLQAPLLARGAATTDEMPGTPSRHSRVIQVSGSKVGVPDKPSAYMDLDDFNFERNYPGLAGVPGMGVAFKTVHCKTVLAQVWAAKLAERGIDVNAFHPGIVRSPLMKQMNFLVRGLSAIVGRFIFSRTSASGEYCALAPELNGITGQFFTGGGEARDGASMLMLAVSFNVHRPALSLLTVACPCTRRCSPQSDIQVAIHPYWALTGCLWH